MPSEPGKPFGEAAKDLTEAQAARYASRLKRRLYSKKRGMSPAEIQRWSRQRRRARQTHPGKRP